MTQIDQSLLTSAPTSWQGCYEKRWQGVITDESMAHPAKFSRSLIERIYAHCLKCGYLRKGDLVGDCFGGIGTGGVMAAYAGLRWVGVELEPRFVKMAEGNFELHRRAWHQVGLVGPRIVQGDSRRFGEVISGQCSVVSSPPYADSVNAGRNGIDWDKAENPETWGRKETRHACQADGKHKMVYGEADGQIGALKGDSVEGVIASPPFTQGASGGGGINVNGYSKGHQETDYLGARTYQGRGGERVEGNIEGLKEGNVEGVVGTQNAECGMKNVEGVVTSPPWEKNVEGVMKASKFKDPVAFAEVARKTGHGASLEAKLKAMADDEDRAAYGETDGQIGNLSGGKVDKGSDKGGDKGVKPETYWQAMDLVYRSCFECIKPGGVIVLVVKDYVKNKKRVPLCDDTARLLTHIGFVMVERIRAMLVTETRRDDLFGGETVERKERKSFFRRLAEKKGSPRIDWEEVLIARKGDF